MYGLRIFYYLCPKLSDMRPQIVQLYQHTYGHEPVRVDAINGSAGDRLYLRLYDDAGGTVIGVGCPDAVEQRAFVRLSESMRAQGLRVPRVIVADGPCYLLEDLGSTSLYDMISRCQRQGEWDEATLAVLRQVMRDLPHLQHDALTGFDLSYCCREQRFTEVNVRWDLNYFKYCFLKGTGVIIDEVRLQHEFDALERELLAAGTRSAQGKPLFLYRDFQSRNVMVRDGQPWYIDYQAGYEGPLYYDLASFLWQARAGYPDDLRRELLSIYLDELRTLMPVDEDAFRRMLDAFVLFRLLQVLGAYGYRGLFERKAAFLSPISQALALVANVGTRYEYIHQLLDAIHRTPMGEALAAQAAGEEGLTVRIVSFSFKRGIPEDYTGNGGGFVFDCRAPHNPGRYAEYKRLTGMDREVIDFLEGRDHDPAHRPLGTELTMPQYMEHVYALVDPAVQTYQTRGFTHLMVCFGCTGGQHRSVYGAEHLAAHLKALHPTLRIELTHREQNIFRQL